MHSKHVAHWYLYSSVLSRCLMVRLVSDLTGVNIMMDASPILLRGWHFSAPSVTADGTEIIAPLSRIDHPVRYYIIDFDSSVHFLPGQSPIIHGLGGRDDDVPELAPSERQKPFDHYKLDIFTLGNVFLKDLRQVACSPVTTNLLNTKTYLHRNIQDLDFSTASSNS